MTGPLAKVRVLELPCIGPGPFATMLLGDLGADVVRVDRPGGPELQVVPPERDLLGRGKRSVTLDLKSGDDVARCLDLAAHADLLVEGFRPGVAERLGVGPANCHARAPRLVYGRMTGWGQDGPYATQAGHDITYVAVAGALSALGPAGGPPTVPLNLVGDFAGALYLVTGLLAALHEARSSGRGQVVDAAMVDSTAHLMTAFHGLVADGAWQDAAGRNLLDGSAPFYGTYRTADDRWLAVGPLEQPFYDEFVARLSLAPEVADRSDPERWPDLHDLFAVVIGARTQDEWVRTFAGSDACVAPVRSLLEAQLDPHLQARGTFVERRGVVQPAPAPRFSRTETAVLRPPPAAGEHTAEVFSDWLG